MKKISIFYAFVTVLCLMVSPVVADPNLYFDFNNDGTYDTSWTINGKQTVKIYLDDWDTSSWSSEDLIGVQMFFSYDYTKIQVNEVNSFANDDDHGGVFDHNWSEFDELEDGKIRLIAAEDNCLLAITDKILVWTLELQGIAEGTSDIYIEVDFPEQGFVAAGGENCPKDSHSVDAGNGSAEITTSEPEPIPTLTEWGMIIFMTIMMGTGVMILRKRRMV